MLWILCHRILICQCVYWKQIRSWKKHHKWYASFCQAFVYVRVGRIWAKCAPPTIGVVYFLHFFGITSWSSPTHYWQCTVELRGILFWSFQRFICRYIMSNLGLCMIVTSTCRTPFILPTRYTVPDSSWRSFRHSHSTVWDYQSCWWPCTQPWYKLHFWWKQLYHCLSVEITTAHYGIIVRMHSPVDRCNHG